MPQKITIKEAAVIMGKCEQFVRIGLQRKLLPFGTAFKISKNQYTYYISPKLFYEYVGEDDIRPQDIEEFEESRCTKRI
jgi:hypothetical protein